MNPTRKKEMRINMVEYAIAERGLKPPTAHFTKTGRNNFIWCLFATLALGRDEW